MHFPPKRVNISLLGLSLLAGCHDKPADTAQVVTPAATAVVAVPLPNQVGNPTADAAVQRMRNLLAGAWLNATYATYLLKTHSPRQAHGHWGRSGITEMLIDPTSLKGDSLAVALGASNHEGLPLCYVHFRAGKAADSWPITSHAEEMGNSLLATTLRYQVRNADTLLFLDQRNEETGHVETTAFRHLPGSSGAGAASQSPPFAAPLARFINGLDFIGTHTMTDSAGHVSSVHFAADGSVQSLPKHKVYQINTDFEGPFHEFGTIFLDIYQKTQEELSFAPSGDTIRLYRVRDDTTIYKRQRGRLRYTLIRQSRN